MGSYITKSINYQVKIFYVKMFGLIPYKEDKLMFKKFYYYYYTYFSVDIDNYVMRQKPRYIF